MSRRRSTVIEDESQVGGVHASGSVRYPPAVENGGDYETDELLEQMVLAGLFELLYADNGNSVLNLATLQRMNIFRLQTEIIAQVASLTKGDNSVSGRRPLHDGGLTTVMADYVQSVRDWESMAEHQMRAAKESRQDPYLINSKYDIVKQVMDRHGLTSASTPGYDFGNLDEMIGIFNQRTRVNKSQRVKGAMNRLILGMFGGVSLVGPMFLMVFHRDIVTATATTSSAVFVFAAIMAFRTEASPEMVVSTVAAYAAVLVVFVGAIQQSC